ncbi:MAG: HEPN domain-containing protein [Candidatus Brocadiales bacterium]|nr:HEPN domain-containing protein [Candidatus Brocadiales bacterium]
MLKTINDVTERLIKLYDPERIILFGSRVAEKPGDGSDIDLLIVKETEKRPIDRRVEVEKILSDRFLPLDIVVYTPQELRFLFSIGNPFIEEIMEKGRIIYVRKATEGWIKGAEDELDIAVLLHEHERYQGSCYHSQQCIEKGLQALILEKGKRPGRIHDIVELLNDVTQLGWDTGLSLDDAVFLNSIYKGRYPTDEGLLPYGRPSSKDAERAISAARKLAEKLKRIS